jgi:hypothetical protein
MFSESAGGFFCCRIDLSPVEAASLMFSESATTQFSIMVSESVRAVCAVESMRHPWKQFR